MHCVYCMIGSIFIVLILALFLTVIICDLFIDR